MLTFFFFFQSRASYFRLRKTARKGRANITPQETASPLRLPRQGPVPWTSVKLKPPTSCGGEKSTTIYGHAAYKVGNCKSSINHEEVSGLGTRRSDIASPVLAEQSCGVTGNKPSSLPARLLPVLLFGCLNQKLSWTGTGSLNIPPHTYKNHTQPFLPAVMRPTSRKAPAQLQSFKGCSCSGSHLAFVAKWRKHGFPLESGHYFYHL